MNPHALATHPSEMRIHMLSPGQSIIYTRDGLDEANTNSAIEYCVQVGSTADVRVRNMVNLVSQILHEPGFDQLRTKEQLGYTVHVGIRKQTEMISLRTIIQSSHHPIYLEHRIEEFLKSAKVFSSNIDFDLLIER
jgi:insulysin